MNPNDIAPQSSTPRTDSEEYDVFSVSDQGSVQDKVVPADFARQLERELAALRAELEEAKGEEWRECSKELPPCSIRVWVSQGGGTCLLAYWDLHCWKDAMSIRSLPFQPIWWQHLRLPESPGPLYEQFSSAMNPPVIHCRGDGSLTSDNASE